ncbi:MULTISPECIES: glycosyltransferase family 4 protein [Metabacillus]|uniref:Glycosyltransferase family 4 protein n=1 Tax=Metabacillus hrfriensis TaxID=3048891 RepID=A0ACD4RAM2_9BACI|nr:MULTISPECIES: glycosyltransferase family 4 protein [Metabacillus]UAL52026.1 glycosyltransferase family 4 protein [Metabacillus dongyingensis]USK28340.1 glycosyltransferase family 4 protein [Bacillus sp. CMF21]WHZ57538.1 glycosyltransferase family 4 protein [Metabacillus sp. CT-WN-B3]
MITKEPVKTDSFFDKWPKKTTSSFDVQIEGSDRLDIKITQLKKDANPIILYYNKSNKVDRSLNAEYTYIAKIDGKTYSGVQVQQVIVGYDKDNNKVYVQYNPLGSEMNLSFPKNVASYSLGLRLSGTGEAVITDFSVSAYNVPTEESQKELFLRYPEADYLIVTNVYPEKNTYYQNMFVHKRVLAYKENGINAAIYRLNTSPASIAHYVYDGVPVFIGGEDALTNLLNAKPYKKVLFHFINERMYRAVRKSKARYTPKLIWVHGFETTKWYRRWFNFYQSTKEIRKSLEYAKRNQEQLDFMADLYTAKDDDIKFIFVSKWYKENVAEKDTNTIIKNYSIIHNAIDDELFNYVEKPEEQRMRILTIRPFASRTYANDLTVKAILELKDKPFFNDLTFDIYGQGPLFNEVVEPIRDIPNVHLHNYFLSQQDIAEQHKSHGIFLSPSRMDSQGVSLGEAMSSGLVPVTSGVYAIPEFIDDSCGFLAESEDYKGLAEAIEYLYYHPKAFLQKSEEAAHIVRYQCGKNKMIQAELKEITETKNEKVLLEQP